MCADALRKGETGRRHTTQTFPLYIFNCIISRPSLSTLSDGGRSSTAHTSAHCGSVTTSNGNKDDS